MSGHSATGLYHSAVYSAQLKNTQNSQLQLWSLEYGFLYYGTVHGLLHDESEVLWHSMWYEICYTLASFVLCILCAQFTTTYYNAVRNLQK